MSAHEQHGQHGHHHGHVHLGEAEWAAMAEHAELEGEVLMPILVDVLRWIDELRVTAEAPVRHVLDVGSGPGVGTCELARHFDGARVTAVDSSPAMLERVARRAGDSDLAHRISTHLAELPHGVEELRPADVIWASMSLHHVGDETAALRVLGERLAPSGLLAVAEVADPMRVLPDALDVGGPGFPERLGAAEGRWFTSMRAGLPDSVPSDELTAMVVAAGLEVVGSKVARLELGAPLLPAARQVVVARFAHARERLADHLEAEDLRALEVLADPVDPRSVANRPDVVLAASRQIVVARRRGGA